MEYLRPRVRLTNYCNRRCEYCFADDYLEGQKNHSHISLKELELFIDSCKERGIKEVAWQGGEPLIHSNIIEIINLHKKAELFIQIFTNGMFNKSICHALSDLDFQMLINLNHPDTYSNKEDYIKIINNIKILNSLGLKEKIS